MGPDPTVVTVTTPMTVPDTPTGTDAFVGSKRATTFFGLPSTTGGGNCSVCVEVLTVGMVLVVVFGAALENEIVFTVLLVDIEAACVMDVGWCVMVEG